MNRHARSTNILAAAALASLLAAVRSVAAEPETSWELAPYRIHLLIAAEPGAAVPRNLSEELAADLPARAATIVGGAWQLEATVAPVELRHQLIHSVADVNADQLPAETLKKDKVILLAIADGESGTRVQAREYDVTTGQWNTVVSLAATQSELIAGRAMQAVLAAFAPLARIDLIDKGTATVRCRAGAIPRRDRTFAMTATGTVLRPVLVTLDDAGRPVAHAASAHSAQPIDWTYLTVTSGGSSVATCRIDTALAGEAIPAYHPRRMRLALGVTPSAQPTRLVVVSSGADAQPLEGIEAVASDTSGSGDSPGKSLGLTDVTGSLDVPPGATAVRMLDIRQGAQSLARVPLVPGLAAEVRLALSDQRSRLAIDTMLAEAEDALVDLAARRQALAARIKVAKKEGQAGADTLLPKLRALASVEAQLTLIGRAEAAIQAADAQTQAQLQGRLEALRKVAQALAAQSPTSLVDSP